MKKIAVAGAGHGGLSAAINLARAGMDVTVYEQNDSFSAGHDWEDAMSLSALAFADIPPLPSCSYTSPEKMAYYNPSKTVKLTGGDINSVTSEVFADRKGLLRHLVSEAEKAGVKFSFGTAVTKAVMSGDTVVGIELSEKGRDRIVFSDLVIDACGVNSPVRRSLPPCCGIENEVQEKDLFSVYRAYFDKTGTDITDPRYSVYLYHMGRPGIDWVITQDKWFDILIGKFSPLTNEEIEESLDDFKKIYPGLGNTVVRGGVKTVIPIRKTLPKIVCGGYAAIGDSACMTVPLNGCGIDLSLEAGKILANAVIAVKNGDFSTQALWPYQYRYFKMLGNKYIVVDAARNFLSTLTSEDFDFFIEKQILTEKEMEMSSGNIDLSIVDILTKIKNALPKASMLPAVIAALKNGTATMKAAEEIPPVYSEKEVEDWIKRYENN